MTHGASRAAGDILDATMPFLRRYGRALTASQKTGDALAMRARQRARKQITSISAKGIRVLLFQSIHEVWTEPPGALLSLVAAHRQMQTRTPGSLETLLLRAIEEFSFDEIAKILSLSRPQVTRLFETSLAEITYRHGKRVLILEDDVLIAMDLANSVADMGYIVTGVARTAVQAADMAANRPPDLLIANAMMADRSSGQTVADRISQSQAGVDVVFMSAEPETLLTGHGDEPVFVISKPFLEDQARNAVRQAFILSRN